MKFIFDPNQLTIHLQGFEKVWALKGRIQVPHYAIRNVTYVPDAPTGRDYEGNIRPLGPGIGRFRAGAHTEGSKRIFRYIKPRQAGILTIACHTNGFAYNYIQLSCPPELAQDVADWWQERK